MRAVLGAPFNLYTAVFDSTEKTLTISGVQGFDLTDSMLDSIYDSTITTFFDTKRVTLTWSYVSGRPVYVYTFFSIPETAASGDTLVITLDIPDVYANTAILQYQASLAA